MSKLLPSLNIEPMRKNRFLVVFPEDMGIRPILVRSVILPSMNVVETYESSFFSSIRTTGRVEVSDCIIKIMPSCGDGLLKKLVDYQTLQSVELRKRNFDFSVQMLDPTGIVVDEYQMLGSMLKEIRVEKLDYADDQPVLYEITFGVSHFIIE
jgi:hypothetical protein